ncbi:MAG TPA: hypothetical protein VFZ11_00220 [Gemmatimonadaceae bacterium]
MRRVRPLAILSVLLLLAAPAVGAQRPRPASGVLLGVAGHGTLWIAPDSSGRLRVMRAADELIVRRASGFWRVGVVTATVEPDTTAPDADLVEVSDEARAGDEAAFEPDSAELEPLSEITPDSLDGGACIEGGACEELGDWFATAVVAAPLDTAELTAVFRAPAAEIEELRATEGHSDFEVTFVAGDWISWTQTVEALDPEVNAGSGAALLRIDSLSTLHQGEARSVLPLSFDAAALARHRRECSKQYVRSDSRMVGDADLFKWPTRSWFLQHLSGRWRLTQRFAIGSGAMRGFVFDCVLSDSLPPSLVGHDRLAPPWSEIRRQLPAATDAVSSPSGDLLVVATDEWLRVFAPRGSRLGAPLLDLPLDFPRIVSAQWAAGEDVAAWSGALAAYMRAGR